MPQKTRKYYRTRDREMVQWYWRGMKTWAIAEKFGVSERVTRAVLEPYRPWREYPRKWLPGDEPGFSGKK